MAKYLITQAFVYQNKHGDHIRIENGIFDTEDPARSVDPVTFTPPVLGLEAMDPLALDALTKVRAKYGDAVWPGVGRVPKARIVSPDGYFNPATATGIGNT